MSWTLCVFLASVLVFTACAAGAGVPETWTVKGDHTRDGGAVVAAGPATLSAPVVPGQAISLTLRLGSLGVPLTLAAEGGARSQALLTLTARDLAKSPWPWKKELVKDAGVDVRLRAGGGPGLLEDTYWIRPNPHFYHGGDLKKAVENWERLPSASQSPLAVRVEVSEADVTFWLDDRLLGRAELRAEKLVLSLKPGSAVLAGSVEPWARDERFVPLRLAGYRRAGAVGETKLSLAAGRREVGGVPFDVAAPGDSMDVGLSRWLEEAKGPDDFTDDYYTRSAFDGTPESILLAVPTGDYSHAHVLCAVDPDPAKTPVLTLRLTRFLEDLLDSGGRGDGIADTAVRLEPRTGRWPEGVTPVGEVELDTPRGRRRVPLLHVRTRLRSGEIQDVLDERGIYYRRSTQSLDLELTRELHPVATASHANYSTKPLGKPSAVRVFGLTLERSPVRVRLTAARVGNVFLADEKPELVVSLANVSKAAFKGGLFCTAADFYGKKSLVSQPVKLEPGEAKTVALDVHPPAQLGLKPLGWFSAILQLVAGAEGPFEGAPVDPSRPVVPKESGELLWEVPTRFAILPAGAREAAPQSPFGTWWFRSIHVGTGSVDEIAPLLQRAGIWRVCPGGSGPSGAELAKHGLRLSMFPNLVGRGAKTEEAIDAQVKAHPDVKWALIFHESGFGEGIAYPPEFIGQPVPKLPPEQEGKFKKLWDTAVAASQIYRRKYPDIKLIFGNGSLAFAVEFMRRGYPKEYVDAFGDEDLGQLLMPERPPWAFMSVYWLQKYAERYGYSVPVTSPYEWRGRPTTPGNLTEPEQAELYARDALQGLAFRMPNINIGLLHDTGDAYYYSRWGGTGLLRRWPLLCPKPSYVAMATLTRELAGARFLRLLPTGSPSLFVAEFERRPELIYALWLCRGEREVTVTFGRTTPVTLTDMLGNSSAGEGPARELKLRVSSSPVYLRAAARIEAVAAGPTACERPPGEHKVVDDLCDPGRWTAVKERDTYLETAHFDFPRRQAKFGLAVVPDGEMGRALEVKLLPQPEVPAPCPRYLVLQAKEPIAAPGRPTAVGLWAKGNSCWGRVVWEFEDAKGEKFSSIGMPEGGWTVADWKSRTYLNFDGWNYLQVRLLTWYESGFYGPERHNWKNDGGDGRVDYPIKLTRLVIELRDQVVHLTESIAVPDPAVRLKDLSVSYEP